MMGPCGRGAIIHSGNWEMELRHLFPAIGLRKFQGCQESPPSRRARPIFWHSNRMEQFGPGDPMALASWGSVCRTLLHTQHLFRFLVYRTWWVYLREAICRTRSSQTQWFGGGASPLAERWETAQPELSDRLQ